MTAATPWSMSKLAAGAYLSRTPVNDRPFVLLAYYEDGSAATPDGRVIVGTRWAVIAFDDEEAIAGAAELAAGLDWFETLDEDRYPDGVTLAGVGYRTRYAARAWAETNLDRETDR